MIDESDISPRPRPTKVCDLLSHTSTDTFEFFFRKVIAKLSGSRRGLIGQTLLTARSQCSDGGHRNADGEGNDRSILDDTFRGVIVGDGVQTGAFRLLLEKIGSVASTRATIFEIASSVIVEPSMGAVKDIGDRLRVGFVNELVKFKLCGIGLTSLNFLPRSRSSSICLLKLSNSFFDAEPPNFRGSSTSARFTGVRLNIGPLCIAACNKIFGALNAWWNWTTPAKSIHGSGPALEKVDSIT